MKRLVLRSFQSPGDLLMLTAAVRDFHAAFPDQCQTDVRTSADELWDNNPHVTPLNETDAGVQTLDMHYPLIHQSNQRPYHFIHAYAQYLEQQLGFVIPVTKFHGEVYLTEEEKQKPSFFAELGIADDFWIVVAGGNQVTQYLYGTTLSDSGIASSQLKAAEIYPDSVDDDDRIIFAYNRQGETTQTQDQQGTIHSFDYDALGRQTQDRVTMLGTGVDNAVRRIASTFEVRGMRERLTSYDNATVGSGSVVNEVVFEHNDFGILEKEYQEHEGAKDGNTLYIQYNFDTTATGGKYTKALRPSSVRYPNGRLVHFSYGSSGGMGDVSNRVDAIKDNNVGSPGATLATYRYLGLGTIVIEDYEEPDVRLEYYFDGSYGGFDRFGRIIDQKWHDYGADEDRERYTYGYDPKSNRLYRENMSLAGKDEYYTYDDINRLTTFDLGQLNASKDAISGCPVNEEDWGLDTTGNWSHFRQKSSGSTDLDQDRTHNKVNEITAVSETIGTSWIDPVHDLAGNMTAVPKPSDLVSGLTCKWDAWNHLVEVKDSTTVVAKYEYDGLARRVKKQLDSDSPGSPDGIDAYVHYFYNRAWQVLETRRGTNENTGPESLQPEYQYVWSKRYIDAPILRDENTDSDGTCDDDRLYYLGDANFNVTTLIDTAGEAIERYTYSPHGGLTIYDATWSNVRSTSSFHIEYTYTGRRLDAETGLYYRHRFYAAELGRFLSWGAIAFKVEDVHPYHHTRDLAMSNADPLGQGPIATVETPYAATRNAVQQAVPVDCLSEYRRCRKGNAERRDTCVKNRSMVRKSASGKL